MSSKQKLAWRLGLIACLMFGFGYLLVPMYNVLCKAAGINGKTRGRVAYDPHLVVDVSRDVRVEFLANRNANLPFEFRPLVTSVEVHPGQMQRVEFYFKNKTSHEMVIQAIPSVTPAEAARYFKKTECFCFTKQRFAPHEDRVMPLFFHLDKKLAKDITQVSLSYTLFNTIHD